MPFVLGLPLARGLERDPSGAVEVVREAPARIITMVSDGALDLGLAPIAATVLCSRLDVIPGLGVACHGPVHSIRLYHRVPLSDIRTVALDEGSRSGAALARVVLEEFEGVAPTYEPMPPHLEAMLGACDAALLIGDAALLARKGVAPYVDLGERWRDRTGLGFVFAMWTRRSGLHDDCAAMLDASLAAGEAEMDDIVEEVHRSRDIPRDEARAYLTEQIQYRLTPAATLGLSLFVEIAKRRGIFPPAAAVPPGAQPATCRGATAGRDEPRPYTVSDVEHLLLHGRLLDLGAMADRVRFRLHPEPVVTYVKDRNVNYTNVCVSRCRFCAFWRAPDDPEAYVLSTDEVLRKVAELVDAGGTQLLMQGGLHPDLGLGWVCDLIARVHVAFPSVDIHSLSPPEVIHLARMEGLTVAAALARLRENGLASLPGGGAEVLSDRVRSAASPAKCTAAEWLAVMREAHRLSIPSTATMMFGHLDTARDRAEHLVAVRDLQDETGGFTAFIPWTFQAANTDLGDVPPVGGHEYLRVLAVSRIVLSNVPNIQASWVTQGAGIAQIALRFGANDLGGTMMEENVVAAAGCRYRVSPEELERLASELGFALRQRRTDYSML
jgi:cyclic dehypoxanthinyl futalosine synthase